MNPKLSRALALAYNTHALDSRVAYVKKVIGESQGKLSKCPPDVIELLIEWGVPIKLIKEET